MLRPCYIDTFLSLCASAELCHSEAPTAHCVIATRERSERRRNLLFVGEI